MTCIVAAKDKTGCVIGADSCTTVGNVKLVKMVNGSKLVKFPNFVVGLSGSGPIKEILDSMLAEPTCEEEDCIDWREHVIENTNDVTKFLDAFMSIYQERGDVEVIGSVGLLFVTDKQIFCTDGESTVFEIDEFWAVGSGSEFALGALEHLYGTTEDLAQAVSGAIYTACKYANGCAPPVETIRVRRG